jgi:hypothetical protein
MLKSLSPKREPVVCPRCGDPGAERLLYMQPYDSRTDWFRCDRCGVFSRDRNVDGGVRAKTVGGVYEL